jgi:RHH-type proline utilization regulon transcriptional repressor/proline dehydrogenase/delta 1-pyrroline-5-carboxylate dehydrogenase
MGEPLYEEVVSRGALNRPCRVYAPVGTHETLLAYLVRRLLENGANTSFVNRIADENVKVSELVANPIDEAERINPVGAPHSRIPLPVALYGAERRNSEGLDLSNEQALQDLAVELEASATDLWTAAPLLATHREAKRTVTRVLNPANRMDVVGTVEDATRDDVEAALAASVEEFTRWSKTPIEQRASCLERAADLMQQEMPRLMGLAIREAGKSLSNAIAEIREAIDFLRYYGAQIRAEFHPDTHEALGPVVCISPWNFPLAIFTGQVAAALASGNTVLAKPAEQTPLIAAEAVRILRQAGVPNAAVQLLPGDGASVGGTLVHDNRVCAVMFTGSTEVARIINRTLSSRLDSHGRPIPLIAETGGQNAMIVDSSALAEQVVLDVLQSAFDSAGQRCSALRVLCLQEESADRTIEMLLGAMQELNVGNPAKLSVDIGPVIDAEAREGLESHIVNMRNTGHRVTQLPLPAECTNGNFVPPTLIEISSLNELKREVFGPVLHVLKYRRNDLEGILKSIRETGYGLTLGIHTRIDETVDFVVSRAHVGNIYVNRNVVGAVVGVQPFGGEGLSGTGPKAGGALYLRRLLAKRPASLPPSVTKIVAQPKPTPANVETLRQLQSYFQATGDTELASKCRDFINEPVSDIVALLPGPTGERNTYRLTGRGTVLCVANSLKAAHAQLVAAIATGNRVILGGPVAEQVYQGLPVTLRDVVSIDTAHEAEVEAVLFDGDNKALLSLSQSFAKREGIIVPFQAASRAAPGGEPEYALDQLMAERTVSVNTTAAGGNANLMTLA